MSIPAVAMRAQDEWVRVVLFGCVFTACVQPAPESSSTRDLPLTEVSISTDSSKEEQPFLIHELRCGRATSRTYYRSVDATEDPYEPSWISFRVVDPSGQILREYADSSVVGFEHIEYDSTRSRVLKCNEGYQFITCYKVKNDDHVIIRVLYTDSDTSFVVPLEWTPDGIYHSLYT
jgi:hypothetical protein